MLARCAHRQIAIWEIMVLIAGAAAGLAWVKVALDDFEDAGPASSSDAGASSSTSGLEQDDSS